MHVHVCVKETKCVRKGEIYRQMEEREREREIERERAREKQTEVERGRVRVWLRKV